MCKRLAMKAECYSTHDAPFDAERRRLLQETGQNPRICRWCGKPITEARRRTWCSRACVDEYLVRRGSIRDQVWRRDHGVCGRCGMNADLLERAVYRAFDDFDDHGEEVRQFLEAMGLGSCWMWDSRYKSFWEAHHKTSVAEGGGQCGLDNLITLCVPCHRAETRELRRRRSKKWRHHERQARMEGI